MSVVQTPEKKAFSAEYRAEVLKAFGHPTRLKMVESLAESSKCVCELQKLVGSDISTVSRHLAVLRNAGIVFSEKKGLEVHYSIACNCIVNFLATINQLCQSKFERELERIT